MIFDVFNGDADGICALHQLRLAEPAESELVTGVKRDIGLLKRVSANAGDRVNALDITVEKNIAALQAMLEKGVQVRWFDHHNPGELPSHPAFEPNIDTAADVCTSLIVDRMLNGRYRKWAVAAAFGDNLHESARRAAEPLGLDAAQLAALQELGECINYNAYGDSIDDLYFHPAELYRCLHAYEDPFDFIAKAPEFAKLRDGYATDMKLAAETKPYVEKSSGAIFILPDAAWARRVSGVYANAQATANPDRAHALVTRSPKGYYVVSVRAPVNNRVGADTLCMRFEGGGGRKAAGGINALPDERLDDFVQAFYETYPE